MAQKMRAVRLFAPKDIRCVEVDVPHIEKDTQVLIKVKSCGVCGSDIPRVMVKGTYHFPTTIGHEFAGQIVDCGDKVKNNLTVGDRVSVMYRILPDRTIRIFYFLIHTEGQIIPVISVTLHLLTTFLQTGSILLSWRHEFFCQNRPPSQSTGQKCSRL